MDAGLKNSDDKLRSSSVGRVIYRYKIKMNLGTKLSLLLAFC